MTTEDNKRLYGRWLSDGTRVTMHGHDFLRVESGMLTEFWALSEQPTPGEGG